MLCACRFVRALVIAHLSRGNLTVTEDFVKDRYGQTLLVRKQGADRLKDTHHVPLTHPQKRLDVKRKMRCEGLQRTSRLCGLTAKLFGGGVLAVKDREDQRIRREGLSCTGRQCKITETRNKKIFQVEYRDNEDLEELLKHLAGSDFLDNY